ncbi:MAG: hypothetical protein KDB07_08110, partial [Planctomycetes bacterium]|nr:hypothetical protein [Planctomycetota bacterium]
ETLNSGNGGYVQTNVVSGDQGASNIWYYDATGGVNGTGAWRMNGWNTASSNRCRKDLTTSTIAIGASTTNLRLTYWHNFNTEQDYDHYMLEYSLNNGSTFNPVPYSKFLLGEPNGYVGQYTPSGLGNYGVIYQQHEAWTGNSNGWTRVIVDLDSLVVSKPANIKFRFRYEQDSTYALAGVRIDDLRITGASTTIIGNGLFDMVVNKSTPTARVDVNTSMEIMNTLTLEQGVLRINNGPTGELLIGGYDEDDQTVITVKAGTTLDVFSGFLKSDSEGSDVKRLRIENGGVVNVTGGTLQLGPDSGISDNFNNALEMLDGGILNVSGGTVSIVNPDGSTAFAFNLPAGTVNLSGTGSIVADGDLLISGTGVLNISGGTLEGGDDMLVSGGTINGTGGRIRNDDDFDHTGGTINDTGTTWEFYGTPAASEIDTYLASLTLYSLHINKSGTSNVRILDPLILLGDFYLDAGTFDHSSGDEPLTVAGDFTVDAGTSYDREEATVTFNGVDQTITLNGTDLWAVVINNTGTAEFVDGLTFGDDLTVAANAKMLVSAGTLEVASSVADAIVLNGLLRLVSNTTVLMADNSNIIINSGAELNTHGTDPSAAATRVTFTVPTPGTHDFETIVNNGGLLTMAGAYYCDGTIDVASSPTIVAISNTEFCSLPDNQGDAFIDITGVNGGYVSFRNVGFERGSRVDMADARNIKADATTTRVTVGGYYGDLSGEAWDNDPVNNVLWADEKAPFSLTGIAGGPIYSIADAFQYLPQTGGTITIRSTYVTTATGRQYVLPAFNEIYGAVVFPSFNGTINLDGFAFFAGANGICIDLSQAGASATVNLFNCFLSDPSRPAGARAVVNDGTGAVNASYCTVDSSDLGTSGLSSATNSLY